MGRTEYVDGLLPRSGLGKVPTGSDERHITEYRSHTLELWRELVSFASVERRALCWIWRTKTCQHLDG